MSTKRGDSLIIQKLLEGITLPPKADKPKKRGKSKSPRRSSPKRQNSDVYIYLKPGGKKGQQVKIVRMYTDEDKVDVQTLGDKPRKFKKIDKGLLRNISPGKKVGTRVRKPRSKSPPKSRSESSPILAKKAPRSKSPKSRKSPTKSRKSASPAKKGKMMVDVCFDEYGRLKCGPGQYCGVTKEGKRFCASKETIEKKFGAKSDNFSDAFRLVGKPEAVQEAVRLLQDIDSRMTNLYLGSPVLPKKKLPSSRPHLSSPSPILKKKSRTPPSPIPKRKSSSPILKKKLPKGKASISLEILPDGKLKCGDDVCKEGQFCDVDDGECFDRKNADVSKMQSRGYIQNKKYYLVGTPDSLRKAKKHIAELNRTICDDCNEKGKVCEIGADRRARCVDKSSQSFKLEFPGKAPIYGSEDALKELQKFIGGEINSAEQRVSSSSSLRHSKSPLSLTPEARRPSLSPSPQRFARVHTSSSRLSSREKSSERTPPPPMFEKITTPTRKSSSIEIMGEDISLSPQASFISPKRKSLSPIAKGTPAKFPGPRVVSLEGESSRGKHSSMQETKLNEDIVKCLKHLRKAKASK